MLTNAFHKRYPQHIIYSDGLPNDLRRFIAQAGQIITQDLTIPLSIKDDLFGTAHNKLSREYGIGRLGEGKTYEEICLRLLFDNYDLWNDRHGDPDYFFKMRIGLIELFVSWLGGLSTKRTR